MVKREAYQVLEKLLWKVMNILTKTQVNVLSIKWECGKQLHVVLKMRTLQETRQPLQSTVKLGLLWLLLQEKQGNLFGAKKAVILDFG